MSGSAVPTSPTLRKVRRREVRSDQMEVSEAGAPARLKAERRLPFRPLHRRNTAHLRRPRIGGFVPGATLASNASAAEDERDESAARDSASNSAKKWPRILQGARPWAVRRRGTSRRMSSPPSLKPCTERRRRRTALPSTTTPRWSTSGRPRTRFLAGRVYAMGRAEAEREVTRAAARGGGAHWPRATL